MSKEASCGTDTFPLKSIKGGLEARWFAGYVLLFRCKCGRFRFPEEFTDKIGSISSNFRENVATETSQIVKSDNRREQRQEEQLSDILEQVEVLESDCILDDGTSTLLIIIIDTILDSTTPFIYVKDSFGRDRKVRVGSQTALKVGAFQKLPDSHQADQNRKVASYEDI